jgi:lipopolysaccharide export system permease protein
LTDVVKNYKQYGYDDCIRKTALEILKTKGFEEDDLKFTGNDINYNYDRAIEISRVYKRNYETVFLYIFIWLFLFLL